MKKLFFCMLLQFSMCGYLLAQNAPKFHIGLDISPYQNIKGQHEIFIEYHSEKKHWLNPFFNLGYANRGVGGGGCKVRDFIENKRANGWFIKIGNDFRVYPRTFISPLLIYNNYKSSALSWENSSKKLIEINNQKTIYIGLSLGYIAINKSKWGIDLRYSGVVPLQKEQFLGASCNETKIGAGAPTGFYTSMQVLVYVKI